MNTIIRHIVTIACSYAIFLLGAFQAQGEEAAKKLNSFPVEIPDSTAVVFRQGDTIGVAIVSNMRMSPVEACDVKWFLRTDGALEFAPSAPGLTTGTIKDTKWIKFGPFNSEWSSASPGRGWVYFDEGRSYSLGIVVQPDLANLSKSILGVPLVNKLVGAKENLRAKVIAK